jgi:putative CocE/NonD family hydrolase
MIPMRDGIHLQTVILTPKHIKGPLPILFERTPYGVPAYAPGALDPRFRELMQDGYIFVFQNLRGRFGSEGVFHLSSRVDLKNAHAVNETTDAYDSVDWLVKNVADNNGKVGMIGVSYPGMTAAMTLLDPNPAVKCISEQASPADQWMNDDFHRYGALRESYAFEYAVMEQASKIANTHFKFDTYDTYQWYLNVGPVANINKEYLHGAIPMWNSEMSHPNYDAFWKGEAWVNQLHESPVPNLNVAGFWDQEDPWGPWKIFRNSEENDPHHFDYIVVGPWYHGEWQRSNGDSIGMIPFGGHETSVEFREKFEAPWFRYWLHGQGEQFPWRAATFQTGTNMWHEYSSWPPKEATATNLYLHSDGTPGAGADYVQYVSDPANPVPYRPRPISPTYPGGDWPAWETVDQRFVEHRPDVAEWISEPLDHNLVVTGSISADLFASTSGTDSDFVVKLIDVYPEDVLPNAWESDAGPAPGQYAKLLNGYELPIAMEVRRGRFNTSYENPKPLVPNRPTEFAIPLRDHDHVFLRSHRIMVQVQSTWFPVIDRNPQKFVPSIEAAAANDFVRATQRVYCSASKPSHIVLPVMPAENEAGTATGTPTR